MRSMELAALAASFADDVIVVEPPSLPYGGTTTSRDAFFETVLGYTN
jgi:ketosteroid isomerase-like protein